MDLVYIPEVLTYGSFRSPQYRDYEQPWNKDYFNYGRSTNTHCQQKQQQHHHQQEKSLSKDSCPLCRESKRRSLAAYIRSKSHRSSCEEIHEEEENETDNSGEKLNNSSECDKTNTDYRKQETKIVKDANEHNSLHRK